MSIHDRGEEVARLQNFFYVSTGINFIERRRLYPKYLSSGVRFENLYNYHKFREALRDS